MSENRRMNSIARRIWLSFLLRTLFILLVVNLVLLATTAGFAAYSAEKSALGASWQANLERSLQADDSLRGWAWIDSLQYSFSLPDGEGHTLALSPVINSMARVFSVLVAAQVVLVFFQYRSFRRRTLYLLTPLRQMAQTAQELSLARFDEQKYHNLEDAIENLSVNSPGARLQTGHSELNSLENAINNLIGRMHESYNQQARFVSDASHELRTPIAVIRGYADLLARWGKDDPKIMEESVSAIREEASNMQRLVEQLLFLARGDSDRAAFSPARVDLAELARETHEEYTLIDPDHIWRLRADAQVPCRGDEAMLKQALRILCDNAIKFSPPGSVISLRAQQDPRGTASLSVQDNGEGIKAEDLPKVFERFFRADPARGRGGAGLGLSIANWIIKRHQGHIDIFSREGLGTRFTLHLPPWKEGGDEAADQADSKESSLSADARPVS
ncbi:MAG TPA: HAMP domain-containing sensor histidine kinase [Clostridia bacterium]|jgi:signal transduction histidine kinase|nr:HAMP domain-containing sensor histidine kinase [Clostridia bacterium]HPY43502.1 HAMP domain-containing sensor histidine kinase [Clostridia bacterium]HQA97434.1 HAMP domain-containing sensor histidine kinase [Clostridia bacterium]HQO55608.1 HAMP domain-containing sensor histidine kinase [Clostridia bacterium]HUM60650.1 HAMP domain-containing sensor histidine kinase [Clostridia bacterium]